MVFLKDSDKKQVFDILSKSLSGDVNLMLFYDTSKEKCMYCDATVDLLKEVAALDGRIKLSLYDINKSQKEAKFLGVDKVPALVVGGKKIYNMLYFGIPAGHEFSSLLEDIIDASNGTTRLSEGTKQKIREIKKPIDIKVFVTPTCPYCPQAVRMAHQFAMENSMIRGSMIEAQEFMDLSSKYEVMGVPKIVINDTISVEGAQPEEAFLQYVMQAASSASK